MQGQMKTERVGPFVFHKFCYGFKITGSPAREQDILEENMRP
jgi:hypothetical protein